MKKEMDNLKEKMDVLRKDLENANLSLTTYSTSMQGVAEICKFCAQKANVQIHEIIEHSRLDCKTWNFDVACDTVCQAIYNYILKQSNIAQTDGGIIDIEVAFVKLIESDWHEQGQEKRICLCGHYHPTRNGPKIQGKRRVISEDGYHDEQLFLSKADYPDILLDDKEIEKAFKLRPENTYDYSQYLGIPVFCITSANTSKMVGLLEIICHGKSVLSHSRDNIASMANHLFTPYAYLFLLLLKMEKALRAIPKQKRN